MRVLSPILAVLTLLATGNPAASNLMLTEFQCRANTWTECDGRFLRSCRYRYYASTGKCLPVCQVRGVAPGCTG